MRLLNFQGFPTWPWRLMALGGLVLVVPLAYGLMQEVPQELQDSPYLRIDPEKIVTDARDTRVPCGECHQLEYEIWQATPHATGFDELHRSEQAQQILDKMDFSLSKRESLCLRCHYTADLVRGQARAIAGVSCESCHGAARDWVEVHNDYGNAAPTVAERRAAETDAHRAQRIAASTEGGMLRPSDDLYAVAANCFECHTVPNEKLINVGGHPSGSTFDLVEWSDAIRHNFLAAQWSDDRANRSRTPARLRQMLVIGAMLEYEYSIRAAAEATERGTYAKAMERRVKRARRGLERIHRTAPIPEAGEILRLGQDLNLAPGNGTALLAAADAISRQAQRFSRQNDGSALAALDPLLRDDEPIAQGEDEDEPAGGEEPTGGDDPTEPIAAGGGEDTSATGTPAAGGGTTAPDPNAVLAQGEQRRRPSWFEASRYRTQGPDGCDCHNDDGITDWWYEDAHSQTALRLINETPRSKQIAEAYGLSPSQMKRGNQICASCHATVVSGEESEEVFEGVSCESCHGPGSGYFKKHQDEGYAEGAPHGMVRLDQAARRAQNCARCHHITDQRLLSSGHPSGEGFNLGERNGRIQHWEDGGPGAGALNSAYASAISGRPVPTFQLASVAEVEVAEPTLQQVVRRGPSGGGSRGGGGSRSSGGGGLPGFNINRPDGPLDLPPLPVVSDSTSTEALLLLAKQRLDLLYDALGRGN